MVDLTQVYTALGGIAAAFITVLGGIAINAFTAKMNGQTKALVTAAFDDALSKTLSLAAVNSQGLIAAKGWDHIEVHDKVIGQALNSMAARFPDALKAVGLSSDLSDPANVASITNALKRALPAAFMAAANSPATPPAPNAPAPAVPVLVTNLPVVPAT